MSRIANNRPATVMIFWLMLCLAAQSLVLPARANDRAGEITGGRTLQVERLITPSGLSGKGQLVGLADSGLDKGSLSDIHPDLQSTTGALPRVVMLRSYTDRSIADDPSGHGTFMAAAIVGSGEASGGLFRGIAPGASLYFQGLLDAKGNIRIPTDINDIFAPAYEAGVRIHVDGWGEEGNRYSPDTAQVDGFVHAHPDFLPVFSAGNSGPERGTLTSQANSKNALVIGSSQVPRPALDPESRYADQPARSSSRGPSQDGRIKPDLLAPGSALISACSSLTESNFSANPNYTRMGGSSMAAAVTGGALALLREQLAVGFGQPDPSAALLKALLINGAQPVAKAAEDLSFGILDAAGTALALQERTFKLRDEESRLSQGQSRVYKMTVEDESMPLKVTLAWTDPAASPAAAAALVNNLDLTVVDPQGKIHLGNDRTGRSGADESNNVEQVTIADPAKGEYTVKVQAGRIGQGGGQNFALVYGQCLQKGIIDRSDGRDIWLTDGTQVDLTNRAVRQVIDDEQVDASTRIQPGSSVYVSPDSAYIVGQTWHTGGIQALPTTEGDLLLEMNTSVRQGGYYLDPRVKTANGAITVNGLTVSTINSIPVGSELKAAINPALQTLWRLEASNQEVEGYIGEINTLAREIKLIGSGYSFKWAPWAAVTFRDDVRECAMQDIPYGTGQNGQMGNLVPGSRVVLQVSPKAKVIQAITVERAMICGHVQEVDIGSNRIRMESGEYYSLYADSSIHRDHELVNLAAIQPGDLAIVQLQGADHTVLSMQAYSQVSYGRVVFASSEQHSLYLIDTQNRSRNFKFDRQTQMYSAGIPIESNSLAPGSWVRIIADSQGGTAWQVDVAQVAEEKVKTVAAALPAGRSLRMTDGSSYIYQDSTRISKGGFSIAAQDLVPGERVLVTTLAAVGPWPRLLAGVEVKVSPAGNPPSLSLTASAMNGVLVVQGFSNGDRLYLYRKDGSRTRMEINNGQITGLYSLLTDESDLRVLAMDSASGAMKSLDVKIRYFDGIGQTVTFADIEGHWAQESIRSLARRGVVNGFGDGTFRPDRNISRAELAAMLSRLEKLDAGVQPSQQEFSDYHDLPWWALQAILAVKEAGLMTGTGDTAFRPNQMVTRRELDLIASRLGLQDRLEKLPLGLDEPNRPVTRGEAAYVLSGL